MRCDQCEMATINGIPCHEHGCPNAKSRWDAETASWVRQHTCIECGRRFDEGYWCCADDYNDACDSAEEKPNEEESR